jgi:hypothetical protein
MRLTTFVNAAFLMVVGSAAFAGNGVPAPSAGIVGPAALVAAIAAVAGVKYLHGRRK